MSLGTELLRYEQIAVAADTSRQTAIANVNTKGRTVASTAGLDTAIAEILNITTGGGGGDASGWVRPSDWLPMPTVLASEQKICILCAVYDHDANYVSLRCRGAYTVDPGDGTGAVNVADNTIWEHIYSYASLPAGTLTSRGYRQAIITITPQAGQNLTQAGFAVKHSASGLSDFYTQPFIDMRLSMPSAPSGQIFHGVSVKLRMLERIDYIGDWVWTGSAQNKLRTLSALRSIPPIDARTTTALSDAFEDCACLQFVNINTEGATGGFSGMFRNCSALVVLSLDARAAGTIATLCSGCVGLQRANINTAGAAGSFSGAFTNCISLQVITGLDMAAATNAAVFATTNSTSPISLGRLVDFVGPTLSFSLRYSRLSASALNYVFTQLPVVVGQTIDVRNTPGRTTCDPTIATAKGWEVNNAA